MLNVIPQQETVQKDNASDQAIVQNANYSVRQFAPYAWGGFIGDSLSFLWPAKPDLLPRWGTWECDMALRVLHYTQHGSLVSGAVQTYIEKFLSIPYEISGGRNLTFQWQDLFFESEFGDGYDTLVTKGLTDYLTLNRGWFMELVSYGDPDTPIKEGAKILGINHLDAMRIYFTGNREWPFLYRSEWGGGLHKMHYTRVVHVPRQSTPNTTMFNMGKSALFDCLSQANAQILLGRHQNELLSDLPPSGVVIFNNVKAEEVEDAMKQFEYARVRDGQNVYRAPLQLSSKDPSQPATVTFVPMATVPEGFDYEKYMDIHVNLVALNFGLDPQDIWPLRSSSLGSGSQSHILAAKTQVKGPGYLSTRMERLWNSRVLPRSLQWKYKAQNSQQDAQTAAIAKTWSDMLSTNTFLPTQARLEMLANQVEAFADVLLDEAGQVRVFDTDPKTVEQVVVADDTSQLDTVEPTTALTDVQGATTAAPMQEQSANPAQPSPTAEQGQIVTKAIDGTSADFVKAMQNAMQAGVDRKASKSQTHNRIQSLLASFGREGMGDGLEYGGVSRGDMSADDVTQIANITLDNMPYVDDLVNEIYSKEGLHGTPESRAPLWQKTLMQFYQSGVLSADGNGLYQWLVGPTDHCEDCARLDKQIHRYKDWVRSEWMPQSDKLECGGWNCECRLERVRGVRVHGNF